MLSKTTPQKEGYQSTERKRQLCGNKPNEVSKFVGSTQLALFNQRSAERSGRSTVLRHDEEFFSVTKANILQRKLPFLD